MLQRIDLRQQLVSQAYLRSVLPRAAQAAATADAAVEPIIAAVRDEGTVAVQQLTEQFDRVRPETVRVPHEIIARALADLSAPVRAALEVAIAKVRAGHTVQLPEEKTIEIAPGAHIRQRWIPIRRVGLYVPGGLALYPSSVVMNVVPAQVAGVAEIVVTSPPQAANDGWPDRTVLAACALLKVTEVYAVGGAQAIALLGFGSPATDTDAAVEPVDVITGPGNRFVTAAKRAMRGIVGIDSEAGPTEIAIIADDTANPRFVAADLISQAEHDPLAASVLITPSAELADAVATVLPDRVSATAHSQRVAAALSGQQSAMILVDDIAAATQVANAYAAEHLEIHTRDAHTVAAEIHHAGAIFIGPYTPVSVGDYCAGSNHVLPTMGGARFSSALNTTTFLKSVQQVEYSHQALAEVADVVTVLTQVENLPAHGEAVSVRFS